MPLSFQIIQIRVETDPADRTQLRMTVGSGDPILTFEYVFQLLKSLCSYHSQYRLSMAENERCRNDNV